MFNNIKNTVKHTVIYSIGNLSTKLIGLVLLPLYTKHLSVADYGMLGILEVTSQILINVFGFRLSVSMMRWFAELDYDKDQKKLVFTVYISTLFIVLVLNGALQPFNTNFSRIFFNSEQLSVYFALLFGSVALEILNKVYLDLLRLKEKSIVFIVATSLKLLTILSLNIYFIAVRKMGIEGILLGQLIGNGVLLILSFPTLLKSMILKFDYPLFWEMFKYGYPLIFSAISAMFLSFSDRYMITYFIGYENNGIYTLAFKIAGVLNMFVLTSFQMGFLPIAYKMYKQDGDKRFYSKVLTYFTFVLVICALGLTIFSPEVINVFTLNNDYNFAYTIVPYICLMYIIKGIQYVFLIGLHNTKKTKYTPFLVSTALVINIILNIITIPRWGISGAAISTVVSTVVSTSLYYYYAQKFYSIPYEIIKIVKMLFLGVIMFYIGFVIIDINLWLRIFIKLVLVASFPFVLGLLKFYEPIELERLNGFWKKWKNPGKWAMNLRNIKIS